MQQKKNNEIRTLRMARYRAEMENYWHLRDNLFHYCFIVLFAATDNFKKNTYPYKFGTLASGSRWRWRQDDLDTLFDINNQGLANKIYSLMNGDKSGTTHLFRGNTSYHWTNIQFYYENEIKSMMLEIMTAMASLGEGGSLIEKAIDCIRKYFWKKAQDYFTKSAYNLDAEWSYEEAWAAMKNGTYAAPVHPLQQSLGSHYEAERAFVELRFIFMASMYGFGAFAVGNDSDTSLGQISFRPAQGDNTFHLTPAINMNPTILVGDSDAKSTEQRLQAGDTADITISTDGDTSIYIQGTDYLSDIGDFSQINLYAENPQLSVQGKRLQTLKVGDESAEKVKTILKSLNILACPSLSEIDARNVSTLTGTIDLSQCPRLKRALFGGSSAGEIILPKGSKIEEFELPNSITNISLVNLPNLTEEGLQYGDLTALTYLRVEGNANIEGFALLKATFEDGAPLTNIRVIGFDYNGDANDATLLATLANGNYFGIDSDGTRNPNIIPVIEGILNIAGSIYEDDAKAIEQAYGQGLVLNVTGGYYMKFQDPEVLRVLLANGVGDGVGITTEQAAAVTSIGTWFNKNSEIKTFEEFEKFINITSLGGYAFTRCVALMSIKLPPSITSISSANIYLDGTFNGCTSLVSVGSIKNIESIGNFSFSGCTSLSDLSFADNQLKSIGAQAFYNCTSLAIEDLQLPNLETLGQNAFYGVKIKKISNLGKITTLPTATTSTQNYGDKNVLEEVVLPEGVTSIPAYSFMKYTHLNSIFGIDKVTSIGNSGLSECISITDLHLDSIITLYNSALHKMTGLKNLVLGENCETIEPYNFWAISKDSVTLISKATTPPSLGNNNNMTFCSAIYVPDASVEAYKTATNWSSYADRIYPMNIYESGGVASIIQFADPAVKAICLANWDNNKDGYFTTAEAASVTSLRTIFRDNAEITSFDEFVNFHNVEIIEAWAFDNCSLLESITPPNSIKTINAWAFHNCAMLSRVNFPHLEGTLGVGAFQSSGITRIENLGQVSIISSRGNWINGCFRDCKQLTFADLPATITKIDAGSFVGCSLLTTLIVRATTPPELSSSALNETPISSKTGFIYVPEESVAIYQTTDIWKNFNIKSINELN